MLGSTECHRGKHKAEEWLLVCIPWTENQEIWIQSQAPLLIGESPQVMAQLLPPSPGLQCLGWGELLLDTCGPGEETL